MQKPEKPENLLPESFGGEKENFSEDKIQTGYQKDVPDILGGANLNYLLDSLGKNLEYNNKISDFICNLPIGKYITTNANNELDYINTPIPSANSETLGGIKPDNKTTFTDADGTLHAPKYNLFDLVTKDHILTFDEKEGLELLGEYVYKDAADGRYAYPDFYNKCLKEYNSAKSAIIEMPFIQPVLTKNGTLGGSNFAVSASSENEDRAAYMSFDGKNTTKWGIKNLSTKDGYLTFYNPKELKIKSITYTASTDYPTEDGGNIEIFGSSNNSSWESLYTGNYTGAANATVIFEINSNKYFKYHKIQITNGESTYVGLGNLTIDAQEKIADIKESENKHKFYDIKDKNKIDELYSKTGVAWYYGVDEANKRIFLPRNDYFFQSSKTVGEYKAAGLPNIEGSFGTNLFQPNQEWEGAFYKKSSTQYKWDVAGGQTLYTTGFDASKSNSIYGASTTVQPPSLGVAIYMVVGNTVQINSSNAVISQLTSSENDSIPLGASMYSPEVLEPNAGWVKSTGVYLSGKIYETFFNKSVAKIGQAFCAGYIRKSTETFDDYDLVINQDEMTFRLPLYNGSESLPGEKFDRLELKATGTNYKAPANGWYCLAKKATASGQFLGMPNVTAGYIGTTVFSSGSGQSCRVYCPVKKDDLMMLNYNFAGDTVMFKFIYNTGNGDLYFKLANALENQQSIDCGSVLQEVNEKVNSEEAADAPMPQYNYTELEVGASGTYYTAPKAGWYTVRLRASAADQYALIYTVGSHVGQMVYSSSAKSAAIVSCPVGKGDKVYLGYTFAGTDNNVYLRFVAAKGSK